ncbi:CHAP domain-containing protein [Pyxidicoccus xibeiensis]|uniref:CHAP domain-containing protein n=1 Tax=Pyxidicoccus xibeiensis TaxID=2906759 RepID=UPI0020A72D65|nr:CHAP domain-containing protein [Pyxidicoccus xibeiensis]MCP3143919.1 CHAP domain-containing protein [Pyxidicoccus xibeiensis]
MAVGSSRAYAHTVPPEYGLAAQGVPVGGMLLARADVSSPPRRKDASRGTASERDSKKGVSSTKSSSTPRKKAASATKKQGAAATRKQRASSTGSTAATAPAASTSRVGKRIAANATGLVGVSSLRSVSTSVPDDCTGLARLAYTGTGIDLMAGPGRKGDNGVTHMYRSVRRRGALHRSKPRPGDLVFFRETYDRNGDGRRNDGLTHVGVVEQVEPGGLVTFIHRGGKGIARSRMHLRWPTHHRARTHREVLNDYLRRPSRTHRAYVTGELFAGFASPEPLAAPPSVGRPR